MSAVTWDGKCTRCGLQTTTGGCFNPTCPNYSGCTTHGQTVMQAAPPRWSTTPPTEPGPRWAKKNEDSEPEIADVVADDDGWFVMRTGESCAFGVHEFALWWPVPIPEPPREDGDR
jgi:hypothetical protein